MVERRSHPEVGEERFRELYETQRLSLAQVAAVTGLSTKTVSRRLAEYGIPTRRMNASGVADPYVRPAEVLTPEALERWVVVDGLSAGEIGRRTGLALTTVTRYLRGAGVPVRSSGGVIRYRIDVKDLVGMRAEGWSAERIAQRYGCEVTTVRRALHKNGLAGRLVDHR